MIYSLHLQLSFTILHLLGVIIVTNFCSIATMLPQGKRSKALILMSYLQTHLPGHQWIAPVRTMWKRIKTWAWVSGLTRSWWTNKKLTWWKTHWHVGEQKMVTWPTCYYLYRTFDSSYLTFDWYYLYQNMGSWDGMDLWNAWWLLF